MAKVSPDEMSEKWARRMTAAAPDIAAGIRRVTESPMERAASKADKWQAGVMEAAQTGKWAQRVRSVSLDDWRRKTLEVGVPRINAGVQANRDKVTKFAEEFLPHLDSGVEKVKRMPDTTLEDRINRSVQMMRHNAEFRRR